jgi:hypothetical protein
MKQCPNCSRPLDPITPNINQPDIAVYECAPCGEVWYFPRRRSLDLVWDLYAEPIRHALHADIHQFWRGEIRETS